MPIILKDGPYRFFFYRAAKFWLDPVRIQRSGGLRRSEIRRVQRIIEENHRLLMEAWNDYFND